MKKKALRAVCALILSVGLLLTGCSLLPGSGKNTSGPTEDLSGLTFPAQTTLTPYRLYRFPSLQDVEENDIGIHPSDSSYEITGEDGQTLLRVSLSLPVVTYVNSDGLQSSVETVLAEAERQFADRIDSLTRRYRQDAKSGYSFFVTPSYSVSYNVTAFSPNRVSLLYNVTETNADGITGTSHVCLVVDLSAGFSVDLSTLFTAGLSDRLLTLVNSALASSGASLLPSYESVAAAHLSDCFLIVPEGICFLFPTGSLASADQGDITVLLSTEILNELLGEYGAVLLSAGDAYVPDPDWQDEP